MYVIAYDVGTTGVKTCLFEVRDTIRLLAGEYEGYGLYILPGGGAEQDADEWWAAYMANGIVTLAGSRLYTSMADTPEIIGEALNRFEEVFKHVAKTDKGLVK